MRSSTPSTYSVGDLAPVCIVDDRLDALERSVYRGRSRVADSAAGWKEDASRPAQPAMTGFRQ